MKSALKNKKDIFLSHAQRNTGIFEHSDYTSVGGSRTQMFKVSYAHNGRLKNLLAGFAWKFDAEKHPECGGVGAAVYCRYFNQLYCPPHYNSCHVR